MRPSQSFAIIGAHALYVFGVGVGDGVGDGVAVEVAVLLEVALGDVVALAGAVVLGVGVELLVVVAVIVPDGTAVGGFAPSHVPPVLPKISATQATFVPAAFTAFATPTQMTGGPTLDGTQMPPPLSPAIMASACEALTVICDDASTTASPSPPAAAG
ncbi:MAG TPA: hypothetical protein VJQ83_05140 [Tepidiformaceae bacterium]|nr:hypothetical protein [Tepidiformaceae bacterium]